MTRRLCLFAGLTLTVAFLFTLASQAQAAQTLTGKWIHRGAKGVSILEIYPGEKKLVGPTKGAFHHSLVLDDGRAIDGDGWYTIRSLLPRRGWLTLHFADGNETTEHEVNLDGAVLKIRHHGVTRTYVRE